MLGLNGEGSGSQKIKNPTRPAEGERTPGGLFLIVSRRGRRRLIPRIERLKGKLLPHHTIELEKPLRFLTPREIGLIDNFLSNLKGDGGVSLVVQKGRLRFLTSKRSREIVDLGNRSQDPQE